MQKQNSNIRVIDEMKLTMRQNTARHQRAREVGVRTGLRDKEEALLLALGLHVGDGWQGLLRIKRVGFHRARAFFRDIAMQSRSLGWEIEVDIVKKFRVGFNGAIVT